MSDDEEYEYDYGSDGEYDYGSDGGGENEATEGGNDDLIDIENSFYGTLLLCRSFDCAAKRVPSRYIMFIAHRGG